MRWLTYPVVIFDCDSTLTSVEGIDVLAAELNMESEVARLTNAAMDGEVDLGDVYGERLRMLNPTRRQVLALKDAYKANVAPDAKDVVEAIQNSGHETWVVSGGLLEPVQEFAIWLGMAGEHVRAVDTTFDPLAGSWWSDTPLDARYLDYSRGNLTASRGKADVITSVVRTGGRRIMIGDGVSDLLAADAVDLFVAFAGFVSRPAVVESARVVIRSKSVAPILALSLGPAAVVELIGSSFGAVALRCFELIDDGALVFNDADLGASFNAALEHARQGR
ncbi:MAG: HAD-IB family phosphatase [Acidimicrobiia bacterium]|nr:HAD-IB family phosphatase [Acidimicrobiia bacterium]